MSRIEEWGGCSVCPRNEFAKCSGNDCEREYTEHLEARIGEMLSAIAAFCDGQSWADPPWKAQPHIAPLFEIARRVGK